MKRSVNLSHTRKPRNVLLDMALTLKDLGYSTEEIRRILKGQQPTDRILTVGEDANWDGQYDEPTETSKRIRRKYLGETERPEFPYGEFDNGGHWRGEA